MSRNEMREVAGLVIGGVISTACCAGAVILCGVFARIVVSLFLWGYRGAP